MKSRILCIVPVMLALAAPAFANDPPGHDEKHEKEKKDKKKAAPGEEHEKDAKKEDKKQHPHE